MQFEGVLDLNLMAIGYNTPELDLIIGGVTEEDDTPPESIKLPGRDKPAVTMVGDLWSLGQHSLVCGNSLEPQCYKKLLTDDAVRMVLTDPPFYVPICGHVRTGDGNGHREFAMASGGPN